MRQLFFILSIAVFVLIAGCSKNPQKRNFEGHIIRDKQLEGFLDLNWGDSKEAVIQKMNRREGVEMYDPPEGFENIAPLEYDHGEFAGMKVQSWRFEFYKNQLCKVELTFEPGSKYKQWKLINKALQEKYGAKNVTFFVDSTTFAPNQCVYFSECTFAQDTVFDYITIMIYERKSTGENDYGGSASFTKGRFYSGLSREIEEKTRELRQKYEMSDEEKVKKDL